MGQGTQELRVRGGSGPPREAANSLGVGYEGRQGQRWATQMGPSKWGIGHPFVYQSLPQGTLSFKRRSGTQGLKTADRGQKNRNPADFPASLRGIFEEVTFRGTTGLRLAETGLD